MNWGAPPLQGRLNGSPVLPVSFLIGGCATVLPFFPADAAEGGAGAQSSVRRLTKNQKLLKFPTVSRLFLIKENFRYIPDQLTL